MNRRWSARTHEERTLLNPAFIALILWHAADGFFREAKKPLPVALLFLVPPLALHPDTRNALPRSIATSMPVWLNAHPFLREGFATRARALVPAIRDALGLGLATGLLVLQDEGVIRGKRAQGRRLSVVTTEVTASFSKAGFTGRWFARAGDIATIYSLWGVKP